MMHKHPPTFTEIIMRDEGTKEYIDGYEEIEGFPEAVRPTLIDYGIKSPTKI